VQRHRRRELRRAVQLHRARAVALPNPHRTLESWRPGWLSVRAPLHVRDLPPDRPPPTGLSRGRTIGWRAVRCLARCRTNSRRHGLFRRPTCR
jgi:hypothetical protein